MLATVEKAGEQQPTRGTAAATEVDFNRERADSKVWELFSNISGALKCIYLNGFIFLHVKSKRCIKKSKPGKILMRRAWKIGVQNYDHYFI